VESCLRAQKINAANSWNFALIDYFHDMSLLKEGDGVNFQKASCTLDGCVKIYTSRVDSVATETGKLLSGLADSGNKKSKGGDEDAQAEGDEDEDGEGEDGVKKKTKKKATRSSEATLAPSFAQLQLKKMELEFSVDPLFKKASADFDEGGAKGLLLNHLQIDPYGRIAFDSSDDAQAEPEELEGEAVDATTTKEPQSEIDVASLGLRFFPDLELLHEQDICPSMKTFELGGGSDALDIPLLNSDDWRKDQSPVKKEADTQNFDDDAPMMGGFDDDDDGVVGGFDVIGMDEVGFGEGGEAWAREAAITTQPRPGNAENNFRGEEGDQALGDEVGSYEANSAQYGIALVKDKDFDRENILSYFDQALQKNWAGPEHWRIRKIKDSAKPATTTKRKEKEPFEIDFMAPFTQAVADMIYTPATSNSTISLPKAQWKSKTRNLLPDDKHFNSRQLLRLFLKPKARIGARRAVPQQQQSYGGGAQSHENDLPEAAEMDEAYWARQQHANAAAADMVDEEQTPLGNYDANFFQDDGLALPGLGGDDDDDHFADAQETFAADGLSQPIDALPPIDGPQESGFGTQLVTQSRRIRPEYVQYARVAKKVDIRRLKEEMWKDMDVKSLFSQPAPESPDEDPASPITPKDGEELKFTDVINNLQNVYPEQTMVDISTSFCFICLLHLANEKGLVLKHDEDFGEIRIKKDPNIQEGMGGGD
jgi:condensin complex subunit 2